MPSSVDTLRGHPFIGAQPAEIQEALINSAKEGMKVRNTFLYREDLRADGIYLVANGVVQWNNTASAGKHLLHPTFSHGSTLGLYEVLTGKPYLCDLRADSLVHCFFLEASHVLSALRTRPEVEEFFWKESSLALAKILLPEHFDGIAIQELRALVMERSIMRTYLRGEIIDILSGEVGFLLEGFLKQEDKDEIIVAPCALMKNFGETCRGRQESLSNQDAVYHVETRSHIAVLDLSTLHPQLRRASTSLMSSAIAMASCSSFEHEGLMRWPDTRHPSELQMRNLLAGSFEPTSRYSSAKAVRKVRGLSRSWIESKGGRAAHLPSTRSNSQAFAPHRQRHMSTSVLPRPQSETRVTTQGKGSKKQTSMTQRKESSSDDSDGEEEHIVCIDSPSSLFQHHLSH